MDTALALSQASLATKQRDLANQVNFQLPELNRNLGENQHLQEAEELYKLAQDLKNENETRVPLSDAVGQIQQKKIQLMVAERQYIHAEGQIRIVQGHILETMEDPSYKSNLSRQKDARITEEFKTQAQVLLSEASELLKKARHTVTFAELGARLKRNKSATTNAYNEQQEQKQEESQPAPAPKPEPQIIHHHEPQVPVPVVTQAYSPPVSPAPTPVPDQDIISASRRFSQVQHNRFQHQHQSEPQSPILMEQTEPSWQGQGQQGHVNPTFNKRQSESTVKSHHSSTTTLAIMSPSRTPVPKKKASSCRKCCMVFITLVLLAAVAVGIIVGLHYAKVINIGFLPEVKD